MSLSLNSKFMTFDLHLPEGRWDLSSTEKNPGSLESVSMSIAWRVDGVRTMWSGQMHGAHISDMEILDSHHGPLQQITVEQPLIRDHVIVFIEFRIGVETPLFLWRIRLKNTSMRTIHCDRVIMLSVGVPRQAICPTWARCFPQLIHRGKSPNPGALRIAAAPIELAFFSTGWQSWTYAGTLGQEDRPPRTRLGFFTKPMQIDVGMPVTHHRGSFTSDMFGVIGDRRSRAGILAGFLSQRKTFGGVEVHLHRDAPVLRMWANGDGVALNPGDIFTTDWACVQFVDLEAEVPIASYLEAVALENDARRSMEIPIGWCSWYYFYQSISQDDILANLNFLQQKRDEIPLEIIQVDDGFQEEVGDWFETGNLSFRDGMTWLAAQIKGAGFRPGLWLAPFLAKPGAHLLREHPEWVLRNKMRLPVNAGLTFGTYSRVLDLTHPAYLNYLHKLINSVVNEWGYDYLKLDFLYGGALAGEHYDPTQTRAQTLFNALNVIREAAGENATLLGCGCPLGSGVGIFDCMRINPDVAPQWKPSYKGIKFLFEDEPGFPSARNAIRTSISRSFLHRRWWVNDPDCLLLRDENTHLTEAEVQCLATVISLIGGSLFVSDHMPDLSQERMGWLAQLLPPLPRGARVVDWFDASCPSKLVLHLDGKVGTWYLVAVLNWADREVDDKFDVRSLGLPTSGGYHVVDFWRASYHRLDDFWLKLSSIPRHGVCLSAVRSVEDPPQWLGDTLHISQGLTVKNWQVDNDSISSQLDLGRSARGKVWLALPSTPTSAVLENQPVLWKQVDEDVFMFDLSLTGKSNFRVFWG